RDSARRDDVSGSSVVHEAGTGSHAEGFLVAPAGGDVREGVRPSRRRTCGSAGDGHRRKGHAQAADTVHDQEWTKLERQSLSRPHPPPPRPRWISFSRCTVTFRTCCTTAAGRTAACGCARERWTAISP